jgi:hypothetical protein
LSPRLNPNDERILAKLGELPQPMMESLGMVYLTNGSPDQEDPVTLSCGSYQGDIQGL